MVVAVIVPCQVCGQQASLNLGSSQTEPNVGCVTCRRGYPVRIEVERPSELVGGRARWVRLSWETHPPSSASDSGAAPERPSA